MLKRKSFLIGCFDALLIALFFGLAESCYLAWFFLFPEQLLYVCKILVCYGVVCVALHLFYTFILNKSTAWAVTATVFSILVSSILIVKRNLFYYALTPGNLAILLFIWVIAFIAAYRIKAMLKSALWRWLCILLSGLFTLFLFYGEGFTRVSENTSETTAISKKTTDASLPNVLILLIDAVDAKHVSFLGYPRKTTPFIDKLSSQGAVFSNFRSPRSTYNSTFALFSGYKPESMNLEFVDLKLSDRFFLIGDMAKSIGYQTYGISWTYYVDKIFGFGQGFDYFENLSRMDPAGRFFLKQGLWHIYKKYFPDIIRQALKGVEHYLASQYDPKEAAVDTEHDKIVDQKTPQPEGMDIDEEIAGRFFDWLDEKPREKFFSFVHFKGAHLPFNVPRRFQYQFIAESDQELARQKMLNLIFGRGVDEKDEEMIYKLYDSRIHFLDSVVESLYANLQKRGLDKNTLIILLSDHGYSVTTIQNMVQALPNDEDPWWEDPPDRPYLAFYHPDRIEPKIVTDKVLSVDIFPTLAEYLGFDLPETADGSSFYRHLIDE